MSLILNHAHIFKVRYVNLEYYKCFGFIIFHIEVHAKAFVIVRNFRL